MLNFSPKIKLGMLYKRYAHKQTTDSVTKTSMIVRHNQQSKLLYNIQ